MVGAHGRSLRPAPRGGVIMKRALTCTLAAAWLLAAAGCGLIGDGNPGGGGNRGPLTADFTVEIAGKYKVILKALDSADKYTWTLDDGTTITGGREVSSVTHTYAELGVYVVGLVVERTGNGNGGSNGSGGGCCGPGPGSPGPNPPAPPAPEIAAKHKAVDLLGGSATLVPVLFFTTWSGGHVTNSFYPWTRVCANAQESRGEALTYRIEIVRVTSTSDPTPIPYPWASSVEYILTDEPLYCFYIPGPGGCNGETWTFRVTLRIRDKFWREETVTKFIFSGCCP